MGDPNWPVGRPQPADLKVVTGQGNRVAMNRISGWPNIGIFFIDIRPDIGNGKPDFRPIMQIGLYKLRQAIFFSEEKHCAVVYSYCEW